MGLLCLEGRRWNSVWASCTAKSNDTRDLEYSIWRTGRELSLEVKSERLSWRGNQTRDRYVGGRIDSELQAQIRMCELLCSGGQ